RPPPRCTRSRWEGGASPACLGSRPPWPPSGGRRGADGTASDARLKAGEGLLGRLGDGEERVELGELEERAEVFVEPGEPELAAGLADLLGEGYQRAKAGRVDVSRARKVDQEAPLAPVQRRLDEVLELLPIAHDQLPFDLHHRDAAGVLGLVETHLRSP